MNFVKRAGLSLWARKSKTLLTLSTFLVIAVMVMAGVLINDATAAAEQKARRSVGAEVTMEIDPSAGLTGQAPRIDSRTADKIGALPQVQKHNYTMSDAASLKGGIKLVTEGVGNEATGLQPGQVLINGILDSGLLTDFRSGKFKLLSGEHLTAADKDDKRLLIEERLAKKNGLKVGDKIKISPIQGKGEEEFTIGGVYRDPRPSSEPDPEFADNPANHIYASIGSFSGLVSPGGSPVMVTSGSFLLNDADDLEAFKKEAAKLAGGRLNGFRLAANDKAIQQMTSPLKSIRSSATLAMWLIALVGAAVLALLANLAVKQRRKEYGVLLSMGEKKSKLIAQQVLETVVVAAFAIGLSSVFTQSLTQSIGQSLLGREASAAQEKLDSWQAPPPGSTGLSEGIDPDDEPVDNADPIDKITVGLDPSDIAVVGGIGLGIGLLATAIPAASVLRLSPRTILTKGK
ncbi:FtsX-like permease family protein [Streptomyces sp. PSAA01]|uniref:FtsX-like permease family protein n=1 Tax=Streptomyces sp. PSAA01 TaxID=2912762 RepID=UPI001F021F3E|nr:FtsX-like permease family protein [Streptomyces sp. PSAA01]MCG0289029.1 FtsX-like permease family protein [Streptomyces sp. PSAA01]